MAIFVNLIVGFLLKFRGKLDFPLNFHMIIK
jgi:hypothetical protein